MQNFYQDNPDLQFQIEQLPWQELFSICPDVYAIKDPNQVKSQSQELLVEIGKFIAQEIAPHSHKLDKQRPKLQANGEVQDADLLASAIGGLQKMGATSLSAPTRVGGLGMPYTLSCAVFDMLSRANSSVMTHYGFCGMFGSVLEQLALQQGSFVVADGQLKSTNFDEQMAGIAQRGEFGAMALTEPGAGSDLSQICTQAKQQTDGTWCLTGQKIWITCGHGQHHLVLARSEDKKKVPGLAGLSLFYVPSHVKKQGRQKVRNITVAGFEDKMGQHGLVTATIDYNNSQAQLVGRRGHGFRNMALLMNRARIFVGFEGLGIAQAAYNIAREHASQRVTMGKSIDQHEMVADDLLHMQANICALRALCFEASFAEEKAHLAQLSLHLQPSTTAHEQKHRQVQLQTLRWQARMLVPLVKYMGSELAVDSCRSSMQILGGMGYMKECEVESLLRDALILPIYEGTNHIQALMVLKDHLQQATRNVGQFLRNETQAQWVAKSARDPLDAQLASLRCVYFSALQTLLLQAVTGRFGHLKDVSLGMWRQEFFKEWDPKTFTFGLLHAKRFCRIAADVAAAKALVQQAHRATAQPQGPWRQNLAKIFMELSLPRCQGLLNHINTIQTSAVHRLVQIQDSGQTP